MPKKKSKLSTPAWILEGCDSLEEYNKTKGINQKKKTGRVFKIRKCPICESEDVRVVLSESNVEGGKEWECRKCGWIGDNIKEEELDEEEFMKYMNDKYKNEKNDTRKIRKKR